MRGEEFTTALTGRAGVHSHEELISIAKSINLGVLKITTQIHCTNLLHDLGKEFIALAYGCTKFWAVDINITEEAFHIRLTVCTDGAALYVLEDVGKSYIEIGVILSILGHIYKEL